MAFNFNIQDFVANEILTPEKLNELLEALRQLQAHLKVYDNTFDGNLNVNGALSVAGNAGVGGNLNTMGSLTRNGYQVYDRGSKPTSADVGAIATTGSSSISGSLTPNNSTSDLGTTSNKWRTVNAITVNGATINGNTVNDGGVRVFSPNNIPSPAVLGAVPINGSTSISGDLTPGLTNRYNLGASNYKWNNIIW